MFLWSICKHLQASSFQPWEWVKGELTWIALQDGLEVPGLERGVPCKGSMLERNTTENQNKDKGARSSLLVDKHT